jgi:glucose-1-phosphate thymidylyltransferase
VSSTAVIENSIIGPNASIEDGTIVKNSIIRDSIVCKNSKVSDACIESSILGDSVEVTGKFKKLNLGDHSKFEL